MKILRRNLSLMLAVRYLNPLRTMFSIITLICLGGVALGVMVLIVVLSVMEGLQREMEGRVLAFAPHYVISQYEGPRQTCISDDDCDWPALLEKMRALPGVRAAYPMLESDAFAQSSTGRRTVHFVAIEPHNEGQTEGLVPMLKEGTFDFGEGLDQECVISLPLAQGLQLKVGDSLHLTPVGSLDEVADIYAMIQEPLATHENKDFMAGIAAFFEGAEPTESGLSVSPETMEGVMVHLRAFDRGKLRRSERDLTDALAQLIYDHQLEGSTLFSPEEQQQWKQHADELAALDRDKEDGKAVKSINEMVMPMDLNVVGIYQAPENMPGPDIYMPLTIAQDVLGYSRGGSSLVQGLSLRIEDANNPGTLPEQIKALLPDLSAPSEAHPEGQRWYMTPWTHRFEQWYKLIANERVMMSFVLSIISLIASFCIMAVMFTMSIQRKREIAVLQAMGATPWKIMRIFLWQGVIIGFIGAVLGVLLALLVLHYRLDIQAFLAGMGMDPFPMEAHGITLPAVYEPAVFIRQAVQAFIMVTLAAVVPAFIVSRQDPAKALRSN